MRRTYLAVIASFVLIVITGCSANVGQPSVIRPPSTGNTAVVTPEPAAPVEPVGSLAPAPDTPAASCPETAAWNTKPEQSTVTAPIGATLSDVRPGRHQCFDRIVFDVAGPPEMGYRVGYVPAVTQQGSGKPVAVAGQADLRVNLGVPAPALFAGFGYQADWPALREIRFAGSFEGQTTFAVGVADKRPFRLFVLPLDNRGLSRVVVDIAH